MNIHSVVKETDILKLLCGNQIQTDMGIAICPSHPKNTEEITKEITEEASEGGTLNTTQPFPVAEESSHKSDSYKSEESGSERVEMNPKPAHKAKKVIDKEGDTVMITISHLSFKPTAPVLQNDMMKQLFVAYTFLDIDLQEMQTSLSLPKPRADQQIAFNFSKVFHVDSNNNYKRRQFLASMLLPEAPDDGKIRFSIVSEPPDDDPDAYCKDVGVAYVSIRNILKNDRDVVDEDIEVFDVQDSSVLIGKMNLTVECLAALQAVEKEMQVNNGSTHPFPRAAESRNEPDSHKSEVSGSERVMMDPKPAHKAKKAIDKEGDTVMITVSHLSLEPTAPVLQKDMVKQLFVAYTFLDIDPQELETPLSLPKPGTDQQIAFNFSKIFHVDFDTNYERRQFLASMLLPEAPDEGKIKFSIVSEPLDDDSDTECEDLGVAYVSIRDILKNGRDVVDEDIEVFDVQDPSVLIGKMNLTVECLAALQAVEKEMQGNKTIGLQEPL